MNIQRARLSGGRPKRGAATGPRHPSRNATGYVQPGFVSMLVALGLALSAALPALVGATVTPASNTIEVHPDDTGNVTISVDVPAKPPKADILIAIDTTGSMAPSITQAKSNANQIVTDVQASVPDSQFAIVSFKDSTDATAEYQVVRTMTGSASDVATAVNGLNASGGGDAPEAHNLVFHKSYNPLEDGPIGWRTGTKKIVIVISDAQPHGELATQGLNDCTNESTDPYGVGLPNGDPHGYVTATELANTSAMGADRTLFMVRQASSATVSLDCYKSIAEATGGAGVNSDTNLGSQIVSLINGAFTGATNLQMDVVSATPNPADASWVSFDPAMHEDVETPSMEPRLFDVTVTVPGGTPSGTYTFDLRALAGGADIGHQTLTVIVPTAAQDPAHQTVNSFHDHDDGQCTAADCTLREAITASNAHPAASGANVIDFNIPGPGTQTIALTSALPDITAPTSIDGTTQTGAACGVAPTLKVELRGNGAGAGANGLTLGSAAAGSTIKGLIVNGFGGDGLHASLTGQVIIQCNVIGTTGRHNGGTGVWLRNVTGSTVGATSGIDGANLISYNDGDGIRLTRTTTGAVPGNRFDGNVIQANGGLGIDLGGDGVTANDPVDGDAGANGLANYPILTKAVSSPTNGGVIGRLNSTASSTQIVTIYYTPTCDPSGFGEGGVRVWAFQTTLDAAGDAQFVIGLNGLPSTGFITSTATDATGATSEFSACAALGPGNDSWPDALDISGSGGNAGSPSAPGYVLDAPGQSRWYKFQVAPGSQIQVDLTNLPADYDVVLFKDISQAFQQLLTPSDLNKLSAEFAGQAFTGQAFTGQAFTGQAFTADVFAGQAFTGQAFTGQAFTGQAFTGQAFTGQAFTGQAFTGQAFTGQAFTGQAFTGQAFTGQAFTGQAFTGAAGVGQAFTAQAFTSAQVRSVIAVSAVTGTGPESIAANSWNNGGSFYIRVSGREGASDPNHPFTLNVTRTGTNCDLVHPIGSAPAPSTTTGIKTVILTDSSRITGTPAEKAALADKLNLLKIRPEVAGAVIDVGGPTVAEGGTVDAATKQRISDLNQQAVDHPSCPYAKNLVAGALKDIIDSYRTAGNPNLAYVVLIGDDSVIPFVRYADQAGLAPESGYIPPVLATSTSEASLRLDYVLGQDAYGAGTQISLGVNTFPVPNLAVGRLVETATEATGMIEAYLGTTGGVIPTPTRSLITGYDFLEDAALAVEADLAAGIGTGSGQVQDTLISPNNSAPSAGWTADQLRSKLLGSRHDVIFLAGHFSANSALAADFSTTVQTTDVTDSTVNLKNSLVFSIGCHSGYNIVDADAIAGVTQGPDWAQAFSRKQAVLIGGTGYQYGDTDFIMYSEQIYGNFARELRVGAGPVSFGQALVKAKQAYLRQTPNLEGIDTKSLVQATLFGLPMMSVNYQYGRITPTPDTAVVSPTSVTSGPGSDLGLKSASLTVAESLTVKHKTLVGLDTPNVETTWYEGSSGISSKPGEPALPLIVKNVNVPGMTLRGVGFVGGTYLDDPSVVPLSGSPTTELKSVHTPFGSPVFYPSQLASPNYFDALSGNATRLMINPAQHRSNGVGEVTSTLRRYSSTSFKLFYSSNIETRVVGGVTLTPALAAAPSIFDVSATEAPAGSIRIDAHVVGDPSAGIAEVWATYTGFDSEWRSVPLSQDPANSTHWTGTVAIPSGHTASEIRFIVQAVNGVGLVGIGDNLGQYFSIAQGATSLNPTNLALDTTPAGGTFGQTVNFKATLGGATPVSGRPVVFTVGSTSKIGYTGSDGKASVAFQLGSTPGSQSLSAYYPGDAQNAPASAAREFQTSKVGTTITLSGPSQQLLDQNSGVTATLKDANDVPIGLRTIYFVVAGPNGSRSSTAITDYAGKAQLGVVPLPVGQYTVTAHFNGSFTLPPSSATVNLTDPTYLSSEKATGLQIIWPFSGFFSPVDNPITVNIAKAGSTVPVKFSLGGNRGLQIFPTGYPATVKLTTCGSANTDPIEETSTANAGLTYDAVANQYQYNWKTLKTYRNCYRLDLKLTDGTTHSALFNFK